ncbi:hypothetical protein [Nitrososphaera sp.]|uniref:hypothetical protein n=1 Tax=Nitrososphaera sp. TaxID=1971748 RepID=UPI00307E657C
MFSAAAGAVIVAPAQARCTEQEVATGNCHAPDRDQQVTIGNSGTPLVAGDPQNALAVALAIAAAAGGSAALVFIRARKQ